MGVGGQKLPTQRLLCGATLEVEGSELLWPHPGPQVEDQTEPRLLLPHDVRAVQRHLLRAGQPQALRCPALLWVWSIWPFLSPSPSLLNLQLEDDIVAKPNYLSTMKNFALQQPSEDWMILEFSQLGFIGVPLP